MVGILSIQSHVAFGHVGNAAVAFPLQTLGHDVWTVPTAVLSNHAGYRETSGAVLPVETVRDLLNGLIPRGVDARCELILSGYLGSVPVGRAVLEAVAQFRSTRSDVRYCCDPVIGDRDSGAYVADGLSEFFRDVALPAANILTPNLFELECLTDCTPGALEGAAPGEVIRAARHLLARMQPGGCVLVTSAAMPGGLPDHIAMLAIEPETAWGVETSRYGFTIPPHGAGDLVAALFAANYVQTGDAAAALGDCAARLHGVFAQTARCDGAELELVAARTGIVSPDQKFEVRSLEPRGA
jgi:pyridoxine kinase